VIWIIWCHVVRPWSSTYIGVLIWIGRVPVRISFILGRQTGGFLQRIAVVVVNQSVDFTVISESSSEGIEGSVFLDENHYILDLASPVCGTTVFATWTWTTTVAATWTWAAVDAGAMVLNATVGRGDSEREARQGCGECELETDHLGVFCLKGVGTDKTHRSEVSSTLYTSGHLGPDCSLERGCITRARSHRPKLWF
jgi:hypothetical protein